MDSTPALGDRKTADVFTTLLLFRYQTFPPTIPTAHLLAILAYADISGVCDVYVTFSFDNERCPPQIRRRSTKCFQNAGLPLVHRFDKGNARLRSRS